MKINRTGQLQRTGLFAQSKYAIIKELLNFRLLINKFEQTRLYRTKLDLLLATYFLGGHLMVQKSLQDCEFRIKNSEEIEVSQVEEEKLAVVNDPAELLQLSIIKRSCYNYQ